MKTGRLFRQTSPEFHRFLSYYFPALAWAAVIFVFSAQPSLGMGGGYSFQMFLERKGAHVFEYAVFAALLFRLFAVHAPERILESALLGAVVALLYAMSDEIHQLFVPGREGKITDVLIDTLGIIGGLAVQTVRYGYRHAGTGKGRGGMRTGSRRGRK